MSVIDALKAVKTAAQQQKLHRATPTNGEGSTVIVLSVADETWAAIDQIGIDADIETGYLLSMFIESMADNRRRFMFDQSKRPPNVPSREEASGNVKQS